VGGSGQNFEPTVGHTDIVKDQGVDVEGQFNPDFVFTAAMNGCALTITPYINPTTNTLDPRKFTAWHFQNASENREKAAEFRSTKNPTDWYGDQEYDAGNQHAGLFEATNILHRGRDNQWSIISQQNETASHSTKTYTKNVAQRPLNFGELDKAGVIKRIYLSLQEAVAGEYY